jgi:hypothetical protein
MWRFRLGELIDTKSCDGKQILVMRGHLSHGLLHGGGWRLQH